MERKILKAKEGMIYTNGESFGNEIHLAKGDENLNGQWYEITLKEYEEILKREEFYG